MREAEERAMVTKFTNVKDGSEDTSYLPGLSVSISLHSKVVTSKRCQNVLLEFRTILPFQLPGLSRKSAVFSTQRSS